MDQCSLTLALTDLPLGEVLYLSSVDSTNDKAAQWAAKGAPHLSLVLADEQTQGRGRAGRKWVTAPGSALATSLILYPTMAHEHTLPRLTALGALAVSEALQKTYHLDAQIKWPNDVLIHQRKVAGVLAEAHWTGRKLMAVILGIGINVASDAINETILPAASLNFPAISVQDALQHPVERLELLHAVLSEILHWLPHIEHDDFIATWEKHLAFHGDWVQIVMGDINSQLKIDHQESILLDGRIAGLDTDGSLKLITHLGKTTTIQFGEVHLRPR